MLADFFEKHAVPRETQDTLAQYHALLIKWQKAKNLIAPSTVDEAKTRHFLDSLQLIPHIKAQQITGPVLDFGSGAGFPGLVLAIAGASLGLGPVHLVESNGKKASFLNTVIRETGARAVVHNERIEALDPFPIALVTARACASLGQLLDWSRPFLYHKPRYLFLKGEKVEEELTNAKKAWDISARTEPSLTDPSGRIVLINQAIPKTTSGEPLP